MRIENVDQRERFGAGQVKVDLADGNGGLVVEIWDLVDEEAQLAHFGAIECIERIGRVLGRVIGAADATGKGTDTM